MLNLRPQDAAARSRPRAEGCNSLQSMPPIRSAAGFLHRINRAAIDGPQLRPAKARNSPQTRAAASQAAAEPIKEMRLILNHEFAPEWAQRAAASRRRRPAVRT